MNGLPVEILWLLVCISAVLTVVIANWFSVNQSDRLHAMRCINATAMVHLIACGWLGIATTGWVVVSFIAVGTLCVTARVARIPLRRKN